MAQLKVGQEDRTTIAYILWFKLEPYARAVLNRYLGTRIRKTEEDVDELLNDSFMLLITSVAANFRSDGRLVPYFRRCVRNLAVDWLGKNYDQRTRNLPLDPRTLARQFYSECGRYFPEEALVAGEELEKVLRIIRGIRHQKSGDAMWLRVRYQLPYERIGAILGVPVSKVKYYLHQARNLVRDRIEAVAQEVGP